MAGGGQESSTQYSRPERVRLPKIRSEVEHPKFSCTSGHTVDYIPPTWYQVQDGEYTHDGSAHVYYSLNHISPDHGRQPAFEGINQSKSSDDGDRCNLPRAQRDGHDHGNGIDAHAFRSSTGKQKQAGGKRPQPASKSVFDQLIRGVEFPTKIMWQ